MKKIQFPMLAAMIICSISFFVAGCKSKEPDIHNSASPSFTISGIVANEDKQLLDSIQLVLDYTAFSEWKEFEVLDSLDALKFSKYTDMQGEYQISIAKIHVEDTTWPSEVSITAYDPAGIYESQTLKVPVEIFDGFPNYPQLEGYICGKAQTDFILVKMQ